MTADGSQPQPQDKPRRDPRVVSEAMRRVRGRDTSPEVTFRKALWAKGLRYRLHSSKLPGKPDIVLPGARLAVFVDGDFWHGNQWQARGYESLEKQFEGAPSRSYWVPKILGNMERDRRRTAGLVQQGWRVLRFWESQLAADLDACVDITVQAAMSQDRVPVAPGLPERTFAEFFAGIGLVRLALERHGWEARFANDNDPQKHEMYSAYFQEDPEGHYRTESIRKLGPDDVPTVTLATASFPCTDLSLAGARNGLKGEQSGALLQLFEIIEGMGDRKPPIILLENVPGFLTSHKGEDFHLALRTLNELGYAVDTFMLDAAWFVPQSRLRMFVVGVRDVPRAEAEVGDPHVLESAVRPRKLVDRIHLETDLRWRVMSFPTPLRQSVSLASILEDLPSDSDWWWSRERTEYLLNQMSERHRQVAEQMIRSPRYKYGTVFRRIRHGRSMAELRADGIAGCLRTPRGGSSRQILLKAGRGRCEARFLTPRECARLQGVPDDYPVDVPMNQAFFGFGDAVCVPAVEWIAEHYLNVVVSQLIRGSVLTRQPAI